MNFSKTKKLNRVRCKKPLSSSHLILVPSESGSLATQPLFFFSSNYDYGIEYSLIFTFAILAGIGRKSDWNSWAPLWAVITSTPLGKMASLTFVSSLENMSFAKGEPSQRGEINKIYHNQRWMTPSAVLPKRELGQGGWWDTMMHCLLLNQYGSFQPYTVI